MEGRRVERGLVVIKSVVSLIGRALRSCRNGRSKAGTCWPHGSGRIPEAEAEGANLLESSDADVWEIRAEPKGT